MSDLKELEIKLESTREIYDDICKQADKDGVRDKEERAMIARVGRKIEQLEARLRVEKSKLENEQDPKAAWQEMAEIYKDLLVLHSKLRTDEDDFADDLNVYLKAITSHLATEDWDSAVNEALLAALWANENELWDEYPDDDEDEDAEQKAQDEETGKSAWDSLEGDAHLTELKKLQSELKADGNRLADKVGASIKSIEKAVADEDWKQATTELLLLDLYLDDHDLYPEDDEETDEGWAAKAGELRELTTLVSQLVAGGIAGASEVAATLGQITITAATGDFDKAGQLLDDAIVRARDLAEELAKRPDDEISDKPEKAWDEAKVLHRRLLKLHAELEKDVDEMADQLNVHLQATSSHLATEDYSSALNELLLAAFFAEENDLWEQYEDLVDDEDDTEDFNGKTIWDAMEGDALLSEYVELLGKLKEQGNTHAKKVGTSIKAIETSIKEENWKAATTAMILLDKFIAENDLEAEVASAEVAELLGLDELKSLIEQLTSTGVHAGTELAKTAAKIMAEATSGNFDTAQGLLDEALAAARAAAADLDDVDAGDIDPTSASISASVGKGGKNHPEDVETVQKLLNENGATLVPDGDCGRKTTAAIESFQKSNLGWKDGKVDPDGKTFRALTGTAAFDDITEAVQDGVEKAGKAVQDAAEKAVDAVTDMVEDAGDFLEGFFGSDEDEKESEKT